MLGILPRWIGGALLALPLLACADVQKPAASPQLAAIPQDVDDNEPHDFAFASADEDDASAASTHAAVQPGQPMGDDEDEDDEDDPDHVHDDIPDTLDFSACLDRGINSPPECPQFTAKSPAESLSLAEVERRVKNDLASLGPISLGPANAGRLFNGVQMPKSDRIKLTDPGNAYGTQETVDSIERAIERVFKKHPKAHKVIVGHLSAKNGGRLRPHKSHQSGRDVDLSYFYNDEKTWYTVANKDNLDREKSWLFVRAFVEDPNVEMILVDTSVQKLLRDYAKSQGESDEFLNRVFQYGGDGKRPIIRHVAGHATHIHVRFFSPNAQKTAKLAAAFLPKPAPPKREGGSGKHRQDSAKTASGSKSNDDYILHRARSGDTLDSLARRYGVSVESIKGANGLKSNAIKQKKTYRIPKTAKNSGGKPSVKSAKRSR